MRDQLLKYYERELTFIRQAASDFSRRYPKIAGRLLLEADKCEDPHVERLIEAFAFLAARVHLKIDDEFPEITESLLQVLYPHFLRPIPSMSVVEFELDTDQGKLTSGYRIDKGTTLYSRPTEDTVCRFKTCYSVDLFPIQIKDVSVDERQDGANLRILLQSTGDVSFDELNMEQIRFFLKGEGSFIHRLYEVLFTQCQGVTIRDLEKKSEKRLLPSCLREVGFDRDEGLLGYSSRSFVGYQLVQEYLSFPEKFLFMEIQGLEPALRGAQSEIELDFDLRSISLLDQKPSPDHFRLGCTPVINLFEKTAEPIRLDHARTEYRVIADVRRQLTTEVYSVDSVSSVSPHNNTVTDYVPFYSFKHSFEKEPSQTFWHMNRRQSEKKDDPGTEVYISLVDLNFKPSLPASETLVVRVNCTNRDLPGLLSFGDPEGDFELSEGAPIRAIRCLVKPTKTRRPPLRYGAQWRLISHLSLNYLSLVESTPEGEPEALREILSLYNFEDSASIRHQIEGILSVEARQVIRRITARFGSGHARGVEVKMSFDEQAFVGTGCFLFASVLEKFLGLYVSINSFSEMIAFTKQRGKLKQWPPRAGYQGML